MDANLIFQKTTLGEQAMQDRGRLAQRDLRTVLILVDGKRTVAEICESRGNVRATESILDQLEHEGFIEPIAGHASEKDLERTTAQIADMFKRSTASASPVPGAGSRAGAATDAATGSEAAPAATTEDNAASGPATAESDTDASPPAAAPAPEEPAARSDSVTLAELAASIREDIPELTVKPAEAAPLPNPFATGPQSVAPKPAGARGADTINPFSVGPGARHGGPVSPPPAQARDPHRDIADVAAAIPPKRRAPLRFRLGAKGVAGIVGGLVFFLLVLVLAYPIDQQALEKALADAVGQPVSIGSVHTALSPAPTLVIENLKVGEGADLTIKEIRAVPQLGTVFSRRKAFSNVSLIGATVPVERLGALASGIGGLGDSSQVTVRRVHLSGLRLALRDAAPQEFHGVADLAGAGQLSRLSLARPDQTLKIEVEGQGAAAKVRIEGSSWSPAEGSPYVFEAVLVEGSLAGTRFTASKIEGRVLGGVMDGNLVLDWSKGMSLEGSVGSSFMPTRAFLQTLGSPLVIDGELTGRLRFKTSADNWATLVANLPVEGDFVAKKGNIDGMDLVEAGRRAGNPPLRGGMTKFDEVRGAFAYDGKQLRLTGIDLTSGIVRASGRLSIDQAQTLSGMLEVQLRGSATQTRMPVALSGTLKAPELTGGRR